MSMYAINRNPQPNGELEMHNIDICGHLPDEDNRIYLGHFISSLDALEHARERFPDANIDGCWFCSPEAHTRDAKHERKSLAETAENLSAALFEIELGGDDWRRGLEIEEIRKDISMLAEALASLARLPLEFLPYGRKTRMADALKSQGGLAAGIREYGRLAKSVSDRDAEDASRRRDGLLDAAGNCVLKFMDDTAGELPFLLLMAHPAPGRRRED